MLKEKHSVRIKKEGGGGHGHDYKVESFTAGFISAKCNILSCVSGGQNGEMQQKKHLHVWLYINTLEWREAMVM